MLGYVASFDWYWTPFLTRFRRVRRLHGCRQSSYQYEDDGEFFHIWELNIGVNFLPDRHRERLQSEAIHPHHTFGDGQHLLWKHSSRTQDE